LIVGVGIDLVEVSRFRRAVERWGERFFGKVFTPEELAEARRRGDFVASLAARFAAKEAAYKAAREQAGRALPLRAFVVRGREGRPPQISLAPGSSPRRRLGRHRWWCSLTHGGGHACAVVVLESPSGEGPGPTKGRGSAARKGLGRAAKARKARRS